MKILVCGASGFIGRAVCERLIAAGHDIVRAVRSPSRPSDIAVDFSTDISVQQWLPRLTGIDVVINAVGIIAESRVARFEEVHHKTPAALFAACAQAGVKRIVQISALGAKQGDTPYFKTKYAADQALMNQTVEWQILRPSLVYGTDGESASMFRMLASVPIIPIPALGEASFQPIHIDDLAEGVERAIDPAVPAAQEIDMVGASRVSYRAMLDSYRRAMGFERPMYVTIPAAMMGIAARLAALIPGAPLTPDNWRMLQAGSAGDAGNMTRLLGRSPIPIDQFIAPGGAQALRQRALSSWRFDMLRYVLAFVWIATAFISAYAYPVADSLDLLRRVGLEGRPAMAALYGASILDFVMGVACLIYPRRALWAIQAILIIGYSGIIALALPEFLVHPFGPVLKNLPILAILFILFAESTSWTTSPSKQSISSRRS